MKHLLDVNVLLALAHAAHPHHGMATGWFGARGTADRFCTCSITEIGFLRVSLQARLDVDLAAAQVTLAGLISSPLFSRLNDSLGGASLPAYVKKPADITDGHLLALAAHHGAKLVTFDAGIPGALALR